MVRVFATRIFSAAPGICPATTIHDGALAIATLTIFRPTTSAVVVARTPGITEGATIVAFRTRFPGTIVRSAIIVGAMGASDHQEQGLEETQHFDFGANSYLMNLMERVIECGTQSIHCLPKRFIIHENGVKMGSILIL